MQITSDMLTTMNDAYRANPVMKAAALAMGHQPLNEVVFNCENAAKGRFLFNHEVETMKVTNQKSSGRCWLFAALNLFREIAAKKMNVEFFELSQNFIAYYDKLEKANYFLDSIMQTLDLPKDDRLVTYIVSTGIQDGGQWDMMANLVKKYGLVPKAAMPETFQSENTRSLNAAINIKRLLHRGAGQHLPRDPRRRARHAHRRLRLPAGVVRSGIQGQGRQVRARGRAHAEDVLRPVYRLPV